MINVSSRKNRDIVNRRARVYNKQEEVHAPENMYKKVLIRLPRRVLVMISC
jgi:hypothetical protein